MDTKYNVVFAGRIKAIDPTEEAQNEVRASLVQLRDLLPANINPEDEPAILFVAGNLAVAGLVNLNDDGIDRETSLAVYKKFKRQQINFEHDRKSVVGYIVDVGLTEFGTDRVITEQEARESAKPFNIAVVIALWRVVNKDLCDYILQASSPAHPDFDSLSLSFEMGFDDYRIVALPRDEKEIDKATYVYKESDSDFGRINASLRSYNGSGLHPDNKDLRVYRIIDEGVIPLGGGVVTVPAAAVKGLTVITESKSETEEENEIETPEQEQLEEQKQIDSIFEEARSRICAFVISSEEKLNKTIKTQKKCVSSFTSSTLSDMKSEDIKALKERAAQATKIEELNEVVASATVIIDAIVAESERQEQLRKETEAHTAKIEEAKQQAQAAAQKLTEDLAVVKAELETIKQAQAAAAAEQAFNERMTAIDATFEFSDEEKSEIVNDIRNLNDEAFAKWMDKSKKLMKEKTKEHKKKMADEAKAAQDALLAKLTEKGVKAKVTDAGLDIEEVIASALENQTSAPAGSIIKPESSDLKTLAKKALAGTSFAGQKLE